jgi:hypothetical protein
MQRIKELIDQISKMIIRTVTGSYKGTITPKVKDEIVALLEKSSDDVIRGTKKIEDQTAELKKISKYLDDADEKAGISTKEELPDNVTRIDDFIKRKADEIDDTPKEGILKAGESIPTKPLDDADEFAKKNFPEAIDPEEAALVAKGALNIALEELAKKTGTTVEEAKQALIEGANQAYLPSSSKRMTEDNVEGLLSYILSQQKMGNENDLLRDIIDYADSPRLDKFKDTAKKIIAGEENPADLGFAKEVPLDPGPLSKAEAEIEFLFESKNTKGLLDFLEDVLNGKRYGNLSVGEREDIKLNIAEALGDIEGLSNIPKRYSEIVDKAKLSNVDEYPYDDFYSEQENMLKQLKQGNKEIKQLDNDISELNKIVKMLDEAENKQAKETLTGVPVSEYSATVEKENKILNALELEIQQNVLKMQELYRLGDIEGAQKISNELKRIQKNTEQTGLIDKTFTPPDRTLNAEGGRIGFADGKDVPGKGRLPITRRGFLGVLGGGIATLLAGSKGLLPTAQKGITAAKTMSAPGMPSWFPLLVSKIQSKGNLVSPAAPNKGEVNAVYKYKDGMTEYRLVEDVNTGRIDVYTTSDDGTQISFEYEPSLQRYFEDGSSVTDDPSFFIGEFRKGSEPLGDFEQYSMGMDEVKSDIRNVVDFATRGTTMKTEDSVAKFIKETKKEEPGFKQGGLVPPQAGPMPNGVGSLFRQRTA